MSDVPTTPGTPTDPSTPSNPTTPSDGTPPTSPPTSGPTSGRGPDRREERDPLRGSRTSGIWAALVGFGLVLVLLVVFVLQNTQEVDITFLGFEGRAPLSAALLIAAAGGILLTAVAGTLRILQLRRRVRREAKRRR